MADYILIRKSRNIISTITHVIMNILLGVGSVLLTNITGSWVLGVILVLISKWRIFAVRPRYWGLNIKSSLVDLIVGISFVLITYCSGTTWLPVHTILAILYSFWLIVIKPKSTETAAEVQSLIAIFLGETALTLIAASYDSIIMVAGTFFITWAATRHILVQSEDNNFAMVNYICGLISAELAWLCHSWLIVYTFAGTGIIVPQLSIIITASCFVFNRVYKSLIRNDGELKSEEFAAPTIFSILVIIMVVVWFSSPSFHL